MNRDRECIVALQKQVRIAREALVRIEHYALDSHSVAGHALEAMNAIEFILPAPQVALPLRQQTIALLKEIRGLLQVIATPIQRAENQLDPRFR